MNVNQILKVIRSTLSKYSPQILTGLGVTGMISTTIMAVRATPKALELIDEAKKDLRIDDLPKTEIIKTCWKCYIPATLTGASSIACIISGSRISTKRHAALLTAYGISETALREYKEKVAEIAGDKVESEIREKIVQDKVENNPITGDNVEVVDTQNGTTTCYDVFSGRYFKSDIESLRKSINDLNELLIHNKSVPLNEWYDEIKLPPIKIGYDMGWNISNGTIEAVFGSLLTSNGIPCITIDLYPSPVYGYGRYIDV